MLQVLEDTDSKNLRNVDVAVNSYAVTSSQYKITITTVLIPRDHNGRVV
jgi:hypothetical protein